MKFNQESAVERAKKDLAERLDVSESEIEVAGHYGNGFSEYVARRTRKG